MDKLIGVDWEALVTPSTSVLEMIVRGTLTYWFCFLYLRLIRRGASQLGITDLLLVTLISDAAQNSMAFNYESVTEGIALVGTLVFWDFAINWLSARVDFLKKLGQPDPILLVKDGQMMKQNLRKELITVDELNGILREQGVDDISKVKELHIEGTGNVSLVRKEE